MILAIDPGNIESGYVIIDSETLKPIIAKKEKNETLLGKIVKGDILISYVAIEKIASYGMPVGAEVFDTCIWIGKFEQAIREHLKIEDLKYVYRKDEKINLCQSMKANDATIKQALVDRFALGQKNYGKGTKKEPGWFYGFAKDIWAAYAVAVTYYDMYIVPNQGGIDG